MHNPKIQRFRRSAVALTLLVSGLALPSILAQNRPARFTGRITNHDGDPIPSAVIVLCNADADLWFITSTDSAGDFALSELPANQFSVEALSPQWRRPTGNPDRMQVWGFNPWTDSIVLQSGQTLQRYIQMGNVMLQPRTREASPPCSPQRSTFRLGEAGLARLLLQQTSAVDPLSGRGANPEDQVKLEAFMNKDGRVISLRLLASSWPPTIDALLTRAAVEAVQGWRYSPPQVEYKEFEFSGQIAVNFVHNP